MNAALHQPCERLPLVVTSPWAMCSTISTSWKCAAGSNALRAGRAASAFCAVYRPKTGFLPPATEHTFEHTYHSTKSHSGFETAFETGTPGTGAVIEVLNHQTSRLLR